MSARRKPYVSPVHHLLFRRCPERGKLRLMATAEGYVMVRRPGCMPFVMAAKDWEKLPIWSAD